MSGVFPDYPAPVIRNTEAGTEMTLMRWGMPPPPRTGKVGRRFTTVSQSVFQHEFFAKFGGDGLDAFLNGFGMLRRGNDRSPPAEDRVLAN